jgi:hypothetical protein
MGKVLKGIIDDGTRKIPIENTFGQLICNIYIRPSDISIMDRYNEFKKDFSSILDPLKNLNIDRNGEPDFDADWAVLKEVEAELKKRINALFDMDEADAIFEKRSPFASVEGKFFCESVIEVIGSLIADSIEEELELSAKRMRPHLEDLESPEDSDDRTTAAGSESP